MNYDATSVIFLWLLISLVELHLSLLVEGPYPPNSETLLCLVAVCDSDFGSLDITFAVADDFEVIVHKAITSLTIA